MHRKLIEAVDGRTDGPAPEALSSSHDDTTSILPLDARHERAGRLASDRPVTTITNDRFGVSKSFVPRLARVAVDWAGDDGMVIGMYGPWGVGKTSVLNMLTDYVTQNQEAFRDVYVCQFNPWLYEDPRILITSFFATIAAELGKDAQKPWARAATALRAMGAMLSIAARGVSMFGFSINGALFPEAARIAKEALTDTSALSGEVSGFIDLVMGGQRKLEEHRAEVEKALRRLGSTGGRIIVQVDDADRLNREELLALLRLIRVVADLPHVTIILAIDDERIRDVLEHIAEEGYGKAYLDKIIQVGIHVPLPGRDAIQEMLLRELERMFSARDIPFPEELLHVEARDQRGPLETVLECIHTPRDLARYRNSLSVLVLSGEDSPDIYPTDAVLVEALHVFFPHIYDAVRRRRRFLTHRLTSEQYRSRGRNVEEIRRQRREELELMINGGTESTLDRQEQRIAHTLLFHLFGEFIDPDKITPDTNDSILRRIRSHLAFDSYFRFSNSSLVPRAAVEEILEELIAFAQVETSEQLAERITFYLGGQDGEAVERVIKDLEFLLRRVSENDIRQLVLGGIASMPFIPSYVRVSLMTMFLDCYVHVFAQRRSTPFDKDMRIDDGAVYWFLHALISRELPFVDSVAFLAGDRCRAWGVHDRRSELLRLWLRLLEADLRENNLASPEDLERIAELFSAAHQIVKELDRDSPVLDEDLSAYLLLLIQCRPELLPNALQLVSCETCGKHVLVCDHQRVSDAQRRLTSSFGDYRSLQAAVVQLTSTGTPSGKTRHALNQFEELISLPAGPSAK